MIHTLAVMTVFTVTFMGVTAFLRLVVDPFLDRRSK